MPDDHIGKPFTDTLGEIEGGRLLRECTEQVREIVLAVMETRKKGALTIRLAFVPTGKGAVEIDVKLDAKVPEAADIATTFFTTRVSREPFAELTEAITETIGRLG